MHTHYIWVDRLSIHKLTLIRTFCNIQLVIQRTWMGHRPTNRSVNEQRIIGYVKQKRTTVGTDLLCCICLKLIKIKSQLTLRDKHRRERPSDQWRRQQTDGWLDTLACKYNNDDDNNDDAKSSYVSETHNSQQQGGDGRTDQLAHICAYILLARKGNNNKTCWWCDHTYLENAFGPCFVFCFSIWPV